MLAEAWEQHALPACSHRVQEPAWLMLNLLWSLLHIDRMGSLALLLPVCAVIALLP